MAPRETLRLPPLEPLLRIAPKTLLPVPPMVTLAPLPGFGFYYPLTMI
jgi:hypothetical protein